MNELKAVNNQADENQHYKYGAHADSRIDRGSFRKPCQGAVLGLSYGSVREFRPNLLGGHIQIQEVQHASLVKGNRKHNRITAVLQKNH